MPRGSARIYTIVLPSGAQLATAAKVWALTCGPWWAASASLHAVAISGAMWALGPRLPPATLGEAPSFNTEFKPPELESDPPIERFAVGETPLDPPDLSTETIQRFEPPTEAQKEQFNTTEDEEFEESGGGLEAQLSSIRGGMEGLKAEGPGRRMSSVRGSSVMAAAGFDNEPGSGGNGTGFKARGKGIRKALVGSYGGTKSTERAVGAALNWLARHQNPDGRWSLDTYGQICRDGSCNVGGGMKCDLAGTALALLPFFGAGQTHMTRGPYRRTIAGGMASIMNSQKNDGDLRGPDGTMYVHGLATLALCEAYGMSGDREVGTCAQRAIHFIERAQNPQGGGWRYHPGEPGDMSVVGWQLMALKSGLMSGLTVNPRTVAAADAFVKSASSGKSRGLFSYQPGGEPTATMTAVGVLCSQYLGARREDPLMIEGINYLMAHPPRAESLDAYYWYYASMAMHNVPGPEWDAWNRQMRQALISTQVRYGCCAGSWNPGGHPHCDQGGRIMVTSLGALTLEVYYRYLPLYRVAND